MPLTLQRLDIVPEAAWRGSPVAEREAAADFGVPNGDRSSIAPGSAEVTSPSGLASCLAEPVVRGHGEDFQFLRWGERLREAYGDFRGRLLSSLPQPMRSQLRRICVRATATRSPAAAYHTWLIDGRVLDCALHAVPIEGDDLTATRLSIGIFVRPRPVPARLAPES